MNKAGLGFIDTFRNMYNNIEENIQKHLKEI